MSWEKKRVLVTGGAGYIGSIVTQALLEKGYSVRVLDCLMYGGHSVLGVWSNTKFEFHFGDIRDSETIQANLEGVDAVVHLAAIVGDPACKRNEQLAIQTNLEASIQLLEECQRVGVSRFIFASTCSNYGSMNSGLEYVDETSELRPISLYAETKVGVENKILELSKKESFPAIVLRFATAYGVSPRMRLDLTVNEFTVEMLCKKQLVVYGEHFYRPYVHIQDIASAVCTALTAPLEVVQGQVFNVGSTSQNFQKQQLVELIRPYAPDATVQYVHKEEDPRNYRVSFEKIHSALDFQIRYTVQDGIKELVKMVRGHIIQDFSDPKFRN